MKLDLKELRRVAEAGPQVSGGCYLDSINREWLQEALRVESLHRMELRDGILALLDRIDALERVAEAAKYISENYYQFGASDSNFSVWQSDLAIALAALEGDK